MIKEYDYEVNENAAISELGTATEKAIPQLNVKIGQFSYVYEQDGKIIGRIVAERFCDTVDIKFFVVKEEYRGQGIGRKLIEKIENEARNIGCKHITLESMSFNSWQFYIAVGYEILAQINDSPIKGETHYYLHKAL